MSGMIGMLRQGRQQEKQPADWAGGARRSRGVDPYVRLLAARGLVRSAASLLRAVERGHRAGYLGLAQVELFLRLSAKLRGLACCLIATAARRSDASLTEHS
jgi:hypothetical protein